MHTFVKLADRDAAMIEKWHKDFETLSHITVTYHKNAEGKLVATSIKKADK